MPSVASVNTIYTGALNGRAGYYSDGIKSPRIPFIEGLDSKLTFGLFRPTGPNESDEMSEILGVMIRSLETNLGFTSNDRNTSGDQPQDFNTGSGGTDYGDNQLPVVTHGLRVISSLDGVSTYMSAVPSLVQENQAGRYYSCSSVGVWHKLEVTAVAVGESFQIKTGEITAASAGRLL